ncbi:3-hydroxybutyrate dehydrogenase [Thalassotalea sp. 1_MG-2023]|uniref:3-hydroxybutyrate dehydrogenase n=1 Tax=Thalassotalea sp. 1_MG-2023 TaxID=3062680 RepID=UPI0026E3877D|nr:3-hydroxybutyrate dehydrogenase [Thalassotalea sp. 1_MG-2023]MDO6426663.1 3-hydroxybutyrate dehydrogenase [Thalassotalea sp. 1_MG-2023]
MKNKTVLITGAASGIGFSIAQLLAKQQANVIITDVSEQAAQQAKERLILQGFAAQAFKLDVTHENDIERLIEALSNTSVDILINNAGIQHVSRLEDFPMGAWQKIIDVLLTGPARTCKAILPKMREQGFGRIINIGSIHGLVASPFKSAYVAAKHGLIGFSKVIALETADCNITINTICPAYVKTPLVEKQIADQAKEHGISEDEVIEKIMLAPMPKKAFIDMDEIAATVQFLASENARNMTGQALVLDGGWTVK